MIDEKKISEHYIVRLDHFLEYMEVDYSGDEIHK
jgi:hypothetical protein